MKVRLFTSGLPFREGMIRLTTPLPLGQQPIGTRHEDGDQSSASVPYPLLHHNLALPSCPATL